MEPVPGVRRGRGARGRSGLLLLFLLGGAGFVVVGAVSLLRGGPAGREAALTFLLIGGIWMLTAMGVSALYGRMHSSAEAERELFESGERALAVVEEVTTTGLVLNHVNQQVVLRLRVRPRGAPEFEHRRKLFVPIHAMPAPGDEIEVAYRPGDTSRVALAADWSSRTGGGTLLRLRRPGAGTADRKLDQLARLEGLRQSGALTHAEFEAMKAQIISEGRGV